MVIIDRELEVREADGKPIRVGVFGVGFMGQAAIRHLAQSVPGMEVVAVCSRTAEKAKAALEEAGYDGVRVVSDASDLDELAGSDRPAVMTAPALLCRFPGIDVILEASGDIESGASLAMDAFANHRHFVTLSAELDATLGPILAAHAREAGVIYSQADGDQPGVTINLLRFVKGIGIRPLLCGSIKGFLDHYRNPSTQQKFQPAWGTSLRQLTSFADGTKLAFEQASIANAAGMSVLKRGMTGPVVPPGTPIEEAASWYPLEASQEARGVVDYVVGASPGSGIFLLGSLMDNYHARHMGLFKMGPGPIYVFYRPYHLCHLETHNSLARAVIHGDATVASKGPPQVAVVAHAKTELQAGTQLDGIGGYHLYGLCENWAQAGRDRLLPVGISTGACLTRRIPRDEPLSMDDVEFPEQTLALALAREQVRSFSV